MALTIANRQHLPPELLVKIMDVLPEEGRLETLRNAAILCKAWHSLLTRALYRNIRIKSMAGLQAIELALRRDEQLLDCTASLEVGGYFTAWNDETAARLICVLRPGMILKLDITALNKVGPHKRILSITFGAPKAIGYGRVLATLEFDIGVAYDQLRTVKGIRWLVIQRLVDAIAGLNRRTLRCVCINNAIDACATPLFFLPIFPKVDTLVLRSFGYSSCDFTKFPAFRVVCCQGMMDGSVIHKLPDAVDVLRIEVGAELWPLPFPRWHSLRKTRRLEYVLTIGLGSWPESMIREQMLHALKEYNGGGTIAIRHCPLNGPRKEEPAYMQIIRQTIERSGKFNTVLSVV
ncbi:hypothetical protein BC832DRAFT_137054 [Gaertneriomyces semiglobifer]|nr:hypothetical protein BC832DRAFT_137054 [Gaertneriomyces semiglobifer]